MIFGGPVEFDQTTINIILAVLAVVLAIWVLASWVATRLGVYAGHVIAGHAGPFHQARAAVVVATLASSFSPVLLLQVGGEHQSAEVSMGLGLCLAFGLGMIIGYRGSGAGDAP